VRLWVLSDWHMEQRIVFDPPQPAFDVLVVAGDVSNALEEAIRMVAALAAGKPAVFVAGNHEWWGDERSRAEKLTAAHASAARHGVHFLEGNAVDIAGVRFAGATLWTPDDPRFVPSVVSLAAARADVIVTHFEPTPAMIAQVGGELWIYGHHHGHGYRRLGERRIVRNALGYPGEALCDGLPAILDYTVAIGERR
jgi:predicted MPP superfamily phosphohydrolase